MEVIGMDVDLKLLMILDEVYKTGSVSRAAANIGMTQPSISIALAKLRNIFNDPLFVRTSRGMEPTPHALAVMKPVREAIALLHSTLGQQVVFDPLKSTRAFRIAMADISQSSVSFLKG
jgi:DNA-binding transcriptional LysR family regulator